MRYFTCSALNVLNYDFCGNLLRYQDFVHHHRKFNMNVFILMKEGTFYITANGTNYTLGPNQFILLKGNEEHYGFSVSPGKISYLWVHFLSTDEMTVISEENLISKTIRATYQSSEKQLYIIPEYGTINSTQRVLVLFNQLLDLSTNEMLYSKQLINYSLSTLMMEVTQEFIESHYSSRKKSYPNVQLIQEWVRSNYYLPVTVKDIASEFSYNPNYLSALFKRVTGTTLVNYINKTKIEMSKSILGNYDTSIKQVAYACGFTDEKYFMKTFKHFEGMTPTQYRKTFTQKYIT